MTPNQPKNLNSITAPGIEANRLSAIAEAVGTDATR